MIELAHTMGQVLASMISLQSAVLASNMAQMAKSRDEKDEWLRLLEESGRLAGESNEIATKAYGVVVEVMTRLGTEHA